MPIFCFLLAATMVAQTPPEQPETMTKLVVRLSGPGIKPKSFSALPKTIYVAPPHYARMEDPPDARQGLQKLTIIAEPDAYSANLINHKGTHAIDKDNGNDLHVPIVLPFDLKHSCATADRLEFGRELEFFEHAGAQKKAGPIINAKPTDEYEMDRAKLVINPQTGKPIKLTWNCGDGEYTYEYITVDELPFDPKLFQKPAGVEWKEMRPDDGSEHG
jgi:hypothetical protein